MLETPVSFKKETRAFRLAETEMDCSCWLALLRASLRSSGFTCDVFESSRASRAAARASRPEDFMDAEDLEVGAALS